MTAIDFFKKRWVLVGLFVILYVAAGRICEDNLAWYHNDFCRTLNSSAAVINYNIFYLLIIYLFSLSAFSSGVSFYERSVFFLKSLVFYIVLMSLISTPLFLWGIHHYDHAETVVLIDNIFFLGLLALAVGHFGLVRWPWLWGGRESRDQIPVSDRRRATLWHPIIALVLYWWHMKTDVGNPVLP